MLSAAKHLSPQRDRPSLRSELALNAREWGDNQIMDINEINRTTIG
jgi:hypothetical protein